MSTKRPLIFLLLGFVILFSSCNKAAEKAAEQRAYTAQESLGLMHLSEDFNVEVFLNEPQVMSPVEMVFDENGRIYVAEMLDYRTILRRANRLGRAYECWKTQTATANTNAP